MLLVADKLTFRGYTPPNPNSILGKVIGRHLLFTVLRWLGTLMGSINKLHAEYAGRQDIVFLYKTLLNFCFLLLPTRGPLAKAPKFYQKFPMIFLTTHVIYTTKGRGIARGFLHPPFKMFVTPSKKVYSNIRDQNKLKYFCRVRFGLSSFTNIILFMLIVAVLLYTFRYYAANTSLTPDVTLNKPGTPP